MIDLTDDAADGDGTAGTYAPTGVIDLHDIWQPPPRYDLVEVRRRLAETARDWLPQLFPRARLSADKRTPPLRRSLRPSAAQRGLVRHPS